MRLARLRWRVADAWSTWRLTLADLTHNERAWIAEATRAEERARREMARLERRHGR